MVGLSTFGLLSCMRSAALLGAGQFNKFQSKTQQLREIIQIHPYIHITGVHLPVPKLSTPNASNKFCWPHIPRESRSATACRRTHRSEGKFATYVPKFQHFPNIIATTFSHQNSRKSTCMRITKIEDFVPKFIPINRSRCANDGPDELTASNIHSIQGAMVKER